MSVIVTDYLILHSQQIFRVEIPLEIQSLINSNAESFIVFKNGDLTKFSHNPKQQYSLVKRQEYKVVLVQETVS